MPFPKGRRWRGISANVHNVRREEDSLERTPSTGKSLEELIGRARRMALRYAQVSPYRLNPDQDIWEGIVKGIGRQAYTFGWPYCP